MALILLELVLAMLAGVISGSVVAVWTVSEQARIDDLRSDREERQENLRFVRDKSSTQLVDRPFQKIDLQGQNLNGLKLARADFSGASLENAQLQFTDLSGAKLVDADLSGVNLVFAGLYGADLTNANLNDAILADGRGGIPCFDATTHWPKGFTPPTAPEGHNCDVVFPGRL